MWYVVIFFSSDFFSLLLLYPLCWSFMQNRKKIITVFLFRIIVKKGTNSKQGHFFLAFLHTRIRIQTHTYKKAGQIKSFEFLAHNLLLLCGCFFSSEPPPILKQWDVHFSLWLVSYSFFFFCSSAAFFRFYYADVSCLIYSLEMFCLGVGTESMKKNSNI